ncbi:NYN domain-containing protein [Arthrobacter sp. Leaf137]|uniref:NYN domain-containing protein n=1 Tax=Arthrobacter sp. Leaf137 TaxID=1736271 RepID=UPI0006F5C85F|nr:NYN domain-containing protein [Arthrobacter sp. Leaf137]KQQ89464.1 hypothetical protein ASF64_17660 [Arthrobacter sp. Leaf137]
MSSDSPAANRAIFYVDGFNLYNGLRDDSGKKRLWLDLVALAKNLRPNSNVVRVNYFTSPIAGAPESIRRQQHYQYALKTKYPNLIKIIHGRHEPRDVECLSCSATWQHYEEKETDVNIALSILQDAYSGAADDMFIVSGDTDLLPAVRMAQTVNQKLFVTAAFPPARYSKAIQTELPSSFTIGDAKLRASQLPEEFKDGLTQKMYKRPPGWK